MTRVFKKGDAAPAIALTTTPASKIDAPLPARDDAESSKPSRRTRARNAATSAVAPSRRRAPQRNDRRAEQREPLDPTSSAIVAPSAAPPETPRIKGSASGLRKHAFETRAPTAASPPPATAPSRTRGKRASTRMAWSSDAGRRERRDERHGLRADEHAERDHEDARREQRSPDDDARRHA